MHVDSDISDEAFGDVPDDRRPMTGVVTKVWTRTTTDDTGPDAPSNHEASVLLTSQAEEPRRFAIHRDFAGTAAVPKPGDFVRIEYVQSTTDRPVITGYAYSLEDDNRPPLAREGHWRRRFGDVYLEAEPSDHSDVASDSDYDIVRIAEKADGLSDPTNQIAIDTSSPTSYVLCETEDGIVDMSNHDDTALVRVDDSGSTPTTEVQTDGGTASVETADGDATIEIDDTGASPNVTIDTTGDITISAGGDVFIDEGGATKPVLTEDAVFEYEQRIDTSDGTGGTTTQTTTTVSNGETTDVELE